MSSEKETLKRKLAAYLDIYISVNGFEKFFDLDNSEGIENINGKKKLGLGVAWQ